MSSPLQAVSADDDCCPRCTLLCRNARTVADAIGMRDWSISVGHEPPVDPDAVMTVDVHDERKLLRIRASFLFWDELDERARRHHLTHELAHGLLRDLYETARRGVEGELSGATYRLFLGQVRLETERLVDILATVISQHIEPLQW